MFTPSKDIIRLCRLPLLALIAVMLLTGCDTGGQHSPDQSATRADSAVIFRLTDIGDSLYALKKDFRGMERAMVYYDSAAQLAENLDDVAVKGYIAFCKASVYNAWNREPEKTLQFFRQAASIYSQGKDDESVRRVYYCRLLVAHAYDNEKGKDSIQCVRTLLNIQDSLKTVPSQLWRKWDFIPDLAWVATNANNYTLAEELLSQWTERAKIVNNPSANNYLDHYYLTRARIDVLKYGNNRSPYLDSLRAVFENAKQNFEKVYYGNNLASLYATADQYRDAYNVSLENNLISQKINDSAGIGSLQNRLLQTELESRQKMALLKEAGQRNKNRVLWLLSGSLAIISLFSYRFFRGQKKYKAQSQKLVKTNKELDQKVSEVDLLGKEMQHRVKNNLQMILSLVFMQQRQAVSTETKANMQQMALRIESIAALHRQLGQQQTGMADLKEYVTTMLGKVVELTDSNKKVLTHFDIEPLTLPARQCYPLGMIINEWMTNSIKYAQVTSGSLSVHISIRQSQDAIVSEYFDSGQLVPCQQVQPGLGLSIVDLLKAQLGATIEHSHENCFHYHLTFTVNGK